jgi:hypothetical protein
VAPGATITSATRAHGVRRSRTVSARGCAAGLKGRWMPDDIMTDGNVSICSSYIGIRKEGAARLERVSFPLAVHFCALHDGSARRQTFASPSIIIRSRPERAAGGRGTDRGRIILLETQRHLTRLWLWARTAKERGSRRDRSHMEVPVGKFRVRK